MSPAPAPAAPVAATPAALAAHLATALAEVERLKADLDVTTRRAAAAESVLRALAPDDPHAQHAPHDPPLTHAHITTLVHAESRAGTAESRLQSVLDAWAELLRTEERAADERKRIDDETRAARRTLYPTALRQPFPNAANAAPVARALPRSNGTAAHRTASPNPRIRPRTASDAPPHAPAKRPRNNNWAHDRAASRSPDALAGPGQPAPLNPDPQHPQPNAHPAPNSNSNPNAPHAAHPHIEPSVEDLLLETVERPGAPAPRALRPEPTLLNVPSPVKPGSAAVLSLAKTMSGVAGGPRSCRQCGQAGRYKDGKCVEKWGPGPAGPGTVCDRCRKKMKRVERRAPAAAPAPAAVAPPLSSPPPTFSPLPPSAASSASPPSEDIASSKEDGSGSGDGEGSADAEEALSVKREMSVGA